MINYKQKLRNISCFVFDVDGVLTDGSIVLMPSGEMTRIMNTKDGYAIKQAINLGYKVAVITGGRDQMVKERLEGLGVFDIYLNSHNKIEDYNDLLLSYNLKPEQVLYMGDDNPDIPVLKQVGVSTCPNDAVADVRQVAEYTSPFDGGKGCVRDVIEQTLKVQGKWMINNHLTQSI